MMPDFLSHSVTAGDLGKVSDGGGVLRMMIPQTWAGASNIPIPPQLPLYWSFERDYVLRATATSESMWAAALGIAITKIASKSWQIESNIKTKAERYQKLFLYADTAVTGWVQFLSKHLRDFLTTDNGAFVEIVRSGRSKLSPIVGLRHLDSLRCTRTGDPKYPLIYRDRLGKMHKLASYQVMMFSDCPDPAEMYYGVGLCAASRAYNAIYKLSAIEWYLREKVAGLRPLAIYIVNGLLQNQLENAINVAAEQQVAKGAAAYMGAVIVGVPGDKPPDVATIPLAELPDRFNRKEEFDIAVLTYANSIGLDPQDLQPLSGQGLGTGTQSEILHSKSAGRGLASWLQQWTHQVNELVLPASCKWAWIEKDIRDMSDAADYDTKRIKAMKDALEAGIVMPEQALQVLVDQDVLPIEFLPTDTTAGVAISDTDKPQDEPEAKPTEEPPADVSEQFAADGLAEIPDASGGGGAEAEVGAGAEANKEAPSIDDINLDDDSWEAARKLGREAAAKLRTGGAIAKSIERSKLKARMSRYQV